MCVEIFTQQQNIPLERLSDVSALFQIRCNASDFHGLISELSSTRPINKWENFLAFQFSNFFKQNKNSFKYFHLNLTWMCSWKILLKTFHFSQSPWKLAQNTNDDRTHFHKKQFIIFLLFFTIIFRCRGNKFFHIFLNEGKFSFVTKSAKILQALWGRCTDKIFGCWVMKVMNYWEVWVKSLQRTWASSRQHFSQLLQTFNWFRLQLSESFKLEKAFESSQMSWRQLYWTFYDKIIFPSLIMILVWATENSVQYWRRKLNDHRRDALKNDQQISRDENSSMDQKIY